MKIPIEQIEKAFHSIGIDKPNMKQVSNLFFHLGLPFKINIESNNMKEETKQPEGNTCVKVVDTADKYNTYKQVPCPPPKDFIEPESHIKVLVNTFKHCGIGISIEEHLIIIAGMEMRLRHGGKIHEHLSQQICERDAVIISRQRKLNEVVQLLDSCRDTVKQQSEMLSRAEAEKVMHLRIISDGERELFKARRQVKAYKGIANKLKKK